MNASSLPKIILSPERHKRLLQGHAWVFSNEVARVEGELPNGALGDIYSSSGQFLGRGFYNAHSLIAARILSRERCAIDQDFFVRRIRQAQNLRAQLYPQENAYRLIFGESDGLPGLVVDRYDTTFVAQSYCLGMDLLLPVFLQALESCFTCENIVLKNTSSIRELEKLPLETKVVKSSGAFPLEITQAQGAAKFWVDPVQGQKSGFFFDQRENREAAGALAKGKTVLDCYAYSGGFSVYAALAGAQSVTAVDSSSSACALIRDNFKLNKIKGEVLCLDVEKALEDALAQKKKFDIIVLDPPALAKTRKNFHASVRKYVGLNALALELVAPGGFLITCSCSHHVDRKQFLEIVAQAAQSAKRTVSIVEMRAQAKDHPILPAMPETEYLKCAIVSVF